MKSVTLNSNGTAQGLGGRATSAKTVDIHHFTKTLKSVLLKRLTPICAIAAVGTSIAVTQPYTIADTTPAYNMTLIGQLPGGTKSWATDITTFGEVVGYSSTAAHTIPHGFWWDPTSGTLTDMGTLTGNPADESYAYGVSTTGFAVGNSEYGANPFRDAFIWGGPGTMMTPIGPPPQGYGIGIAEDIEWDWMNNVHRAVGHTTHQATGNPHATVWQYELGTSTSLGTLTGSVNDWSRAFGVNQWGDVVGMSTRGGLPTHAFLDQGAGMIDIDGRPIGGDSYALGVNGALQIVGFFKPTAASVDSACRWQWIGSSWNVMDLGPLPDPNPLDSVANDINDAGLVVGWSNTPQGGGKHACMWLNDQIYDLNDLVNNPPFTLKEIKGINLAGQLVGYGFGDLGIEQAFILDPATLIMNTPVPGIAGMTNDFYVNGATPSATIHVVYGFSSGITNVPGCSGLVIDIANAQIAGTAVADSTGTALLSALVPNAAAGMTIHLQALEHAACTVSNRITFLFK